MKTVLYEVLYTMVSPASRKKPHTPHQGQFPFSPVSFQTPEALCDIYGTDLPPQEYLHLPTNDDPVSDKVPGRQSS